MAFKWQRHVPHPVLGIIVGDFNHDGIGEMVVVTMYGVHVLRPDYVEEATRLRKTLAALRRLQPHEEEEDGNEEVGGCKGQGGAVSSSDGFAGGTRAARVSSSSVDDVIVENSWVRSRK